MSLLNRIKQIAGLGISLSLELPQQYFVAGSPISFTVTIESLENIRVRKLIAELVSGAIAPHTPEWGSVPALFQAEIATNVEVEGGKPRHIVTKIHLPADAQPTQHGKEQARHWVLRVSADIPNAPDPVVFDGFVVALAHRFRWETHTPINVKKDGDRLQVTARVSYTIAVPEDIPLEELRLRIDALLPQALEELLNERPQLLYDEKGETLDLGEETRFEVAGALREVLGPRVRESEAIPLDSFAELIVDEISAQLL